jgi:hypothetical protein
MDELIRVENAVLAPFGNKPIPKAEPLSPFFHTVWAYFSLEVHGKPVFFRNTNATDMTRNAPEWYQDFA